VPGDLVSTLTQRLEWSFRHYADPDRAEGARAYMRNQFAFYGIRSPTLKLIEREATAGLRSPTEAQLVKMARACWGRDEREWQYFACGYLRRHVHGKSPKMLNTVRKLIETKPWWDTIDSLAIHTVGQHVGEHRELARDMDRWVASDNMWIARTAILHQISYKANTDVDRLFGYCLERSDHRDFFIRKAIGWALREYSKTDEHAVRAFVRGHAYTLSGLSRTEALKWVERRAARR
jgi:3-methyladenine DNA glycosylase AlkD